MKQTQLIAIIMMWLCMVCTGRAQANVHQHFKTSIYVRAYEVDKMKDLHWLDSTWTVISRQLKVDKV